MFCKCMACYLLSSGRFTCIVVSVQYLVEKFIFFLLEGNTQDINGRLNTTAYTLKLLYPTDLARSLHVLIALKAG